MLSDGTTRYRARRLVDGKRVALGTYATRQEAEDVASGRAEPRPELTPYERFWSNVVCGPGCWEWQRQTHGNGYGRFALDGSNSRNASRAAWELTYGAIPEGLCVLHKCDNRKCVRPEHLFLGTHRDNTLDMIAKGRHGAQRRKAAADLAPKPRRRHV